MNTLRGRRARTARPRRRVTSLAAMIAADREHYAALVADCRSELEVLSVYLDGLPAGGEGELRRWADTLALLGWEQPDEAAGVEVVGQQEP